MRRNNDTAAKVSTVIRAHSEIRVATEWQRFKHMSHALVPQRLGTQIPRGLRACAPRRERGSPRAQHSQRCSP